MPGRIQVPLQQVLFDLVQRVLQTGGQELDTAGIVGELDLFHSDFREDPQIACGAHVGTAQPCAVHFELESQERIEDLRFAFSSQQYQVAAGMDDDILVVDLTDSLDFLVNSGIAHVSRLQVITFTPLLEVPRSTNFQPSTSNQNPEPRT